MRRELVISAFFILSAAPLARGADSNFTAVSDEAIDALGRLHAEAEKKIEENDYKAALRLYEEIIFAEPDDEAAYVNMGNIYLVLGNTDKAEEAFISALHINPENEAANRGLLKIRDPDADPSSF